MAATYTPLHFVFALVGLLLLLGDIGLDILTVVKFYEEEAWFCLGLMVVFLVVSSVLVNVYSWLWYSYEDFKRRTKVESAPSVRLLKILHFFQLGIYLRQMGMMEMSVSSLKCGIKTKPAQFVFQDMALLGYIEAFSENLPQLLLMVTINIQQGHLDPVTMLKAVASACGVSLAVTKYHRSLRSFLPLKHAQKIPSTVAYFSWNLLLIAARLSALALFASVFPCFILAHFACLWLVFFICLLRTQTIMSSTCGQWLFRSTVALIWYFNWYDVVGGKTFLYHGFILFDIALLCGLWFWKMNPDFPNFNYEHAIGIVCIFFVYLIGVLVKAVYYKYLHPKVTKQELKETAPELRYIQMVSHKAMFKKEEMNENMEQDVNTRMKKLVQNSYQ